MDNLEVLEAAEILLEAHRESLMLDNFIKITLEIVPGSASASKSTPDPVTPLAWTLTLDPDKHEDVYDVHYSVIECILTIMLSSLGKFENKEDNISEKKGVISRLSSAIATLHCDDIEDDDEEDDIIEEEDDDDE